MHTHTHTHKSTRTHRYCTENHSGWAMERRMCLWSWQMVHVEVGMSPESINLPNGVAAVCCFHNTSCAIVRQLKVIIPRTFQPIKNTLRVVINNNNDKNFVIPWYFQRQWKSHTVATLFPTHHRLTPDPMVLLRLSGRHHHASSVDTDGWGTKWSGGKVGRGPEVTVMSSLVGLWSADCWSAPPSGLCWCSHMRHFFHHHGNRAARSWQSLRALGWRGPGWCSCFGCVCMVWWWPLLLSLDCWSHCCCHCWKTLSPNLIQAARDPLLTSWPEASAVGLPRCRSYGASSCCQSAFLQSYRMLIFGKQKGWHSLSAGLRCLI